MWQSRWHRTVWQLTRVAPRKKQRSSEWTLLPQSPVPVLFTPSPSHSKHNKWILDCPIFRFCTAPSQWWVQHCVWEKSQSSSMKKCSKHFCGKVLWEKHWQERVIQFKDKVKSHMDFKSKLPRAKNGWKDTGKDNPQVQVLNFWWDCSTLP